jgi:hypothetical protein
MCVSHPSNSFMLSFDQRHAKETYRRSAPSPTTNDITIWPSDVPSPSSTSIALSSPSGPPRNVEEVHGQDTRQIDWLLLVAAHSLGGWLAYYRNREFHHRPGSLGMVAVKASYDVQFKLSVRCARTFGLDLYILIPSLCVMSMYVTYFCMENSSVWFVTGSLRHV